MRLRSVNLGLALTLTLASTAKADGFPFLPPLDEPSYETAAIAGSSAEPGASVWFQDELGQWVELPGAVDTTGALPTNLDHALRGTTFAPDAPISMDDVEQADSGPAIAPESFVIMDLAEAEPLPLQAISSFDLTLSADALPTAPFWDTL
jgi:hypothetical protein